MVEGAARLLPSHRTLLSPLFQHWKFRLQNETSPNMPALVECAQFSLGRMGLGGNTD